MNKTVLALVATSSFVSTGCFSLIGMALDSRKEDKDAQRAENASFAKLDTKYGQLEKKYADLPKPMDELSDTYQSWMELYRSIDSYRENDYFGSKHIGSCIKSDERRKSDHCKQALALRGKVVGKLADVLHAAVDAEPSVTSSFPIDQIIRTQADSELAAAVDVEASLTKAMPKWNEFYAKRLRKAGGAENLARKENHGICFFSEAQQGESTEARFAFNRATDQLYMHCVAPQPIASYDRTQQDVVEVSLETTSYPLVVDSLPGNGSTASQAYDSEIAMAAIRKKAMKSAARDNGDDDSTDAKDGSAGAKPWRFVLANVSYATYQKVGQHSRESGDRIVVEDDIDSNTLASGFAVIDMEADLFKNNVAADDGDAADADGDASDATPPKAKHHKSKKTSKRHKHKKA